MNKNGMEVALVIAVGALPTAIIGRLFYARMQRHRVKQKTLEFLDRVIGNRGNRLASSAPS
jgi:hypothetical protein